MSSKTPPIASSSKKAASRGLGRGLSSLLGDSGIATATGATAASDDAAGAPAATGFQDIPIEWINVGPWQPRRRFDKVSLDELASSIRHKMQFAACAHQCISSFKTSYKRIFDAGSQIWQWMW